MYLYLEVTDTDYFTPQIGKDNWPMIGKWSLPSFRCAYCIQKVSVHSVPSRPWVPTIYIVDVNSTSSGQCWRGTKEQPLTSGLGLGLGLNTDIFLSMLNASQIDCYKYQKKKFLRTSLVITDLSQRNTDPINQNNFPYTSLLNDFQGTTLLQKTIPTMIWLDKSKYSVWYTPGGGKGELWETFQYFCEKNFNEYKESWNANTLGQH